MENVEMAKVICDHVIILAILFFAYLIGDQCGYYKWVWTILNPRRCRRCATKCPAPGCVRPED